MKYYVLSRGDQTSDELMERFHQLAAKNGMQRDDLSPDIVVSIGGDGTLLQAFHHFLDHLDHIAFVGIHTGHLGFYADWKPNELETLVELMSQSERASENKRVEYPLIEVEIHSGGQAKTYYALNECTIRGARSTLVAQLCINGGLFEMFRGDGICISTPSGSTAYNKSLGGAIVHPALEAIQIAEMASINNRVFRTLGSSILLPKHHHCEIVLMNDQPMFITVDHLPIEVNDLKSIRLRVAQQKVRFARYRPFPFWDRVKEAFIGSKHDGSPQ
ncbi:NAD kinase [Marinicrinis lubricantis]|uniref:NAD kinase n=1 Tax=Marinicrinis lubricantis TaxID=2086470 RepID=A0ABW1IQ84_9BACL